MNQHMHHLPLLQSFMMIFLITYFPRFETSLLKQNRIIVHRARHCVGMAIKTVHKFTIGGSCCIEEKTYFKLLPPLKVE
jgi:hypothetical protein